MLDIPEELLIDEVFMGNGFGASAFRTIKTFGIRVADCLRACAHCGFKSLPQQNLCWRCHERIQSLKLPSEKMFERRGVLKIYSLFEWKEEDRVLASYLHSLKVDRDPRGLWKDLALEFLLMRRGLGGGMAVASIVTPPSCRPGWTTDHAFHFGEALSELTGLPHISGALLDGSGGGAQKLLSRQGRKGKSYTAIRGLSRSQTPPLWVDDVVTTGHTALAALAALKVKPQETELWCLARRLKLATSAPR